VSIVNGAKKTAFYTVAAEFHLTKKVNANFTISAFAWIGVWFYLASGAVAQAIGLRRLNWWR
jgi:hypothetical protein